MAMLLRSSRVLPTVHRPSIPRSKDSFEKISGLRGVDSGSEGYAAAMGSTLLTGQHIVCNVSEHFSAQDGDVVRETSGHTPPQLCPTLGGPKGVWMRSR
eukprot:976341-Pyramimonas_sp.AAC.1